MLRLPESRAPLWLAVPALAFVVVAGMLKPPRNQSEAHTIMQAFQSVHSHLVPGSRIYYTADTLGLDACWVRLSLAPHLFYSAASTPRPTDTVMVRTATGALPSLPAHKLLWERAAAGNRYALFVPSTLP